MNHAKNIHLTDKEVEEIIADSEKWEDGTFGESEEFIAVSAYALQHNQDRKEENND